jgi:hypothetical protein
MAEAAFLAETAAQTASGPPEAERPLPSRAVPVLPAVETLVPRIPAGLRTALDELFRAKFTKVRRFAPAPGADATP